MEVLLLQYHDRQAFLALKQFVQSAEITMQNSANVCNIATSLYMWQAISIALNISTVCATLCMCITNRKYAQAGMS